MSLWRATSSLGTSLGWGSLGALLANNLIRRNLFLELESSFGNERCHPGTLTSYYLVIPFRALHICRDFQKFLLHQVSIQPLKWSLVLAVPPCIQSPTPLSTGYSHFSSFSPNSSITTWFIFPSQEDPILPPIRYSIPNVCGYMDGRLLIEHLTANTHK